MKHLNIFRNKFPVRLTIPTTSIILFFFLFFLLFLPCSSLSDFLHSLHSKGPDIVSSSFPFLSACKSFLTLQTTEFSNSFYYLKVHHFLLLFPLVSSHPHWTFCKVTYKVNNLFVSFINQPLFHSE